MSDSPSNGSKKRKADDGTPIVLSKELEESAATVRKALVGAEWVLTCDDQLALPSDNIRDLAVIAATLAVAMPKADITIHRCKNLLKTMDKALNNPKEVEDLKALMETTKPEDKDEVGLEEL